MSKEESKRLLKLKDLPPPLQKKYKNSLLFAEDLSAHPKKFEFDLRKLKERKAEKEKTIEEKLEQFQINRTEKKYLINVFNALSASHNGKYFTASEVEGVLLKMELRMLKSDIHRMIWEFDENLNKKITEKQFINMYKKCTIDKAGAESKNLFHLTQFMMYCKPGHYTITVEDTLELLYVRAKIETEAEYLKQGVSRIDEKVLEKEVLNKLQIQIQVIFDNQEKTAEGIEKEIGFEEYLQRINKRAIKKRQKEILQAKSVLKYGEASHIEAR